LNLSGAASPTFSDFGELMNDVIFVAATLGFFLFSAAFIVALDRV
jgi:hypothetical protein